VGVKFPRATRLNNVEERRKQKLDETTPSGLAVAHLFNDTVQRKRITATASTAPTPPVSTLFLTLSRKVGLAALINCRQFASWSFAHNFHLDL